MATWTSACEKLLRSHGAVLVRQGGKHSIWLLNGQRFVISRGTRSSERRTKQVFHMKLRRAVQQQGER